MFTYICDKSNGFVLCPNKFEFKNINWKFNLQIIINYSARTKFQHLWLLNRIRVTHIKIQILLSSYLHDRPSDRVITANESRDSTYEVLRANSSTNSQNMSSYFYIKDKASQGNDEVCIYVCDDLISFEVSNFVFNDKNVYQVWCEVKVWDERVFICSIYRPFPLQKISKFSIHLMTQGIYTGFLSTRYFN